MTHQYFNNNAKIHIIILAILLILFVVASILLVISIIHDNTITHTVASSNDSLTVSKVQQSTKLTLEEKYATIFEWQVYTGDFGTEQLYFLKEQCDKYEIPMEIMLSLICTESGFRSTAKASTSSASGYCQIIKSTAEWVYEDLLKYGEYDIQNHTEIMTTNWKLNIELGCRLLYCLYWNSNQSWEIAIQKYYGGSTEANTIYLNSINKRMYELFDMTIQDIQ